MASINRIVYYQAVYFRLDQVIQTAYEPHRIFNFRVRGSTLRVYGLYIRDCQYKINIADVVLRGVTLSYFRRPGNP